MLRILSVAVAFAGLCACAKGPSAQSGPLVAEGRGVAISAGYLRDRLLAQSPPVRQLLVHNERKQKFVADLVRFELLAQAAEREGLAYDPEVKFQLKKAMVERYHARYLERQAAAVPEAEIQKYYDSNRDQYVRPAYVHPELVFIAAAEGSPARAAKAREAQALLAALRAEFAAHPDAVEKLAKERSDDAATKQLAGDVGLKTRADLEIAYGKEVAAAAFGLGARQLAPAVVETPRGFYLVSVVERQEEQVRKLADVRRQIAATLADERKDELYEAMVAKLIAEAQVKVDEAALQKIGAEVVSAGGD